MSVEPIKRGMVLELDRDCELGRKGERAVVMEVEEPCMSLLFPARSGNRKARTGIDYTFFRVVPDAGAPARPAKEVRPMSMDDKAAALESIRVSSVKAGQIWRHRKTGHLYFIVAVGLDETTLDPVVVYSGRDGTTWVRKLSVFLDRPNGQWRFVNDDDPAVMAMAAAYLARGA